MSSRPRRPKPVPLPPPTPAAARPAARAWPAPVRTLFAAERGHDAALDGLRALSVILVVLFHCAVWLPAALPEAHAALPGGLLALCRQLWLGVDVFFVLSGFLIGRILMRRLQDGPLGFRWFYLRRTFRIFPIYYLVLAASVFLFSRIEAWGPIFGQQPWAELVEGSWANFLYVSNYAYGMQVPNALSWGWSLCVEEHFYLLLPATLVALFRVAKSGGRVLVLALAVGLPALFRWTDFTFAPQISVFEWLHPQTHTHADGLALGVLVAYAQVFHPGGTRSWVRRLGPATWILALAAFGSVVHWGGLWARGPFPVVWQFLVLALGAALLLLNGLHLGNRVSRFLSLPVWTPIARVSYCTYLVHVFVIHALIGAWPRGGQDAAGATVSFVAFCAVVLLATFLIAAASYLVLERPLMEMGARLAARHAPRPREARFAA